MRLPCRRWAIGATLLLLGLSSAFFWAERVRVFPDPRANLRVLDRHGKLLAERPSEKYGYRTWVSLDSMAPVLIDAVLQQEDRRFYQHFGIDPLAIVRALFKNIRGEGVSHGGCTLS